MKPQRTDRETDRARVIRPLIYALLTAGAQFGLWACGHKRQSKPPPGLGHPANIDSAPRCASPPGDGPQEILRVIPQGFGIDM